MFGFLAATSLVGLAAAGWPIYLHLRRERDRTVQVVPSLRLFRWRNRPARRRKIEDALLLTARVGATVALTLLLSQPFLDSIRDLPFPLLIAAEEEGPLLGVVIDDGLSSFHGAKEAERFERSRAWLLEQIDRLPENAHVSVATTTYPRPAGVLPRAGARALVEGMRPVPKGGNASEALTNLVEQFGERSGALVIAAPLEEALWPAPGNGAPALQRVFFLDTSRWRTRAYIRRVLRGGSSSAGGSLTCELGGDPESLEGQELRVVGRRGKEVARRRISLHEALRSSAILEEAAPEEKAIRVSLAGGGSSPHPWSEFHLVAGASAGKAARPIVFLEEGPEAALAARVLEATLKAIRPEFPPHFVPLRSAPAVWPAEAATAVFIGSRPPPPELNAWLERRLEVGLQVLCLPAGTAAGGGAPACARLPVWELAGRLAGSTLTPLRFTLSQIPDTHRFDEILLGELGGLEVATLWEPRFPGSSTAVISSSSGNALLSLNRPNERSAIWALGIPLSLDEGSLAYHPIFPLLLQSLLFPSAAQGNVDGGATVGETLNVGLWFGKASARGSLTLPSGRTISLGPGRETADWISIAQAGIYELRSEAGPRLRAANHPRPTETGLLEQRSWQEGMSVEEAVWIDEDTFVKGEELKCSPRSEGAKPSRRYDLSVAVAVLLVTSLAAELVFLGRSRRRT